jgi:cyclophilin family peptidyl-prolyl cis-trans isomerase
MEVIRSMSIRNWTTALFSTVLAAGLLSGCGQDNAAPKQGTMTDQTQQGDQGKADGQARKTYKEPPKMIIDKSKEYTAILKTTKGDITIKLFDDQAPITVNNFVFLAKEHFYDGVKFHRVIKDFMIQTGDPLGNGRGGPGYKFQDELPPVKPYAPGIVAMANAGPNTNGSQFFIGSGDSVKNLNKMPNYTVFGEVIAGMETVQAISSTPVTQSETGEKSKPTEDVLIQSITIQEK